MDWLELVDKDLYCTGEERIVECITRAYDYGLIHIPLIENNELLGLVDFYKLAGIIGSYRNNFSKINCKDLRNAITRARASKKDDIMSIIRRMTLGNLTSIGIIDKTKTYEGTVTARSIAHQLMYNILSDRKIGEVASYRVGIVGPDADLYQILSIISRRRQPCIVVFNGYSVEGIVCLDDVMYMLSQFEGSLPLYESTSRDVVKQPKIVDARHRLGDKVNEIMNNPLLVSEDGEIVGLLSIEDILVYARKTIIR